MKDHLILKDFAGNQTGNGETQHFVADTIKPLSDSLAAIAVKEGWAKLANEAPKEVAKTPKKEALKEPTDDAAEETPAEDRETKVTGPDDTKVEEPKSKKKGK